MLPDPFLERLAIVRRRFAATLEAKISETVDALPHLAADGNATIEKLAGTYQRIHQIVGVGPTVGFVATGQAARNAEEILITPFKSKRGLTAEEAARLQTALDALQTAARSELQTIISKE
jgi:hypothetical protein